MCVCVSIQTHSDTICFSSLCFLYGIAVVRPRVFLASASDMCLFLRVICRMFKPICKTTKHVKDYLLTPVCMPCDPVSIIMGGGGLLYYPAPTNLTHADICVYTWPDACIGWQH